MYTPDALAVVVASDWPVNTTVEPAPPVPVIVPEIENVCGATAVAAKLSPVTLAVVIAAFCDAGPKVNPVWLGVTV